MDPEPDMNTFMQEALDKIADELRSLGFDVELDGDLPLFNKLVFALTVLHEKLKEVAERT